MKASEIITEKRAISKLLVSALISALAASPSYSSDDAVKDAYDLARQIYHAKDLSQAGVEEEAKQEIKNILRSIQGHPNQSKILDIFKNMWKSDVNEYGVGKITAQNATADVKPGDEFKNVKKLQLDDVGHPDKLTSPENTLVINTPGDLDWYKIGQHYPTLDKMDPKEYGQSDSDMVVTFANKAEKEKFEKIISKAGVKYKDIGGTSIHPEIHGENPVNEVIRKQGNNYVIYSKKGKKLGSYTTKKAAQKRLGQIEYFKHAG